jgi:hypothetical protein
MNRTALYDAGVALGRAHVLKMYGQAPPAGAPAGPSELVKASTFLLQCGRSEQAAAVGRLAQKWKTLEVSNLEFEIALTQREVDYPDLHAFSAGVRLGQAQLTAFQGVTPGVKAVVEHLDAAKAHLVALPAKGAVAGLIDRVRNNIQALLNPPRPNPRDLPAHLSEIVSLQTRLRGLIG